MLKLLKVMRVPFFNYFVVVVYLSLCAPVQAQVINPEDGVGTSGGGDSLVSDFVGVAHRLAGAMDFICQTPLPELRCDALSDFKEIIKIPGTVIPVEHAIKDDDQQEREAVNNGKNLIKLGTLKWQELSLSTESQSNFRRIRLAAHEFLCLTGLETGDTYNISDSWVTAIKNSLLSLEKIAGVMPDLTQDMHACSDPYFNPPSAKVGEKCFIRLNDDNHTLRFLERVVFSETLYGWKSPDGTVWLDDGKLRLFGSNYKERCKQLLDYAELPGAKDFDIAMLSGIQFLNPSFISEMKKNEYRFVTADDQTWGIRDQQSAGGNASRYIQVVCIVRANLLH